MKFILYNVIVAIVFYLLEQIFRFFNFINGDLFDYANVNSLTVILLGSLVISFFLNEKAKVFLELD